MGEDFPNKTGKLTRLVKSDTPDIVKIDGSWSSLIIWFVGRFGILAIVSLVFGMATKEIYQDMRDDRADDMKQRMMLIEAFRENTEVMKSFENTMNQALREIKR